MCHCALYDDTLHSVISRIQISTSHLLNDNKYISAFFNNVPYIFVFLHIYFVTYPYGLPLKSFEPQV